MFTSQYLSRKDFLAQLKFVHGYNQYKIITWQCLEHFRISTRLLTFFFEKWFNLMNFTLHHEKRQPLSSEHLNQPIVYLKHVMVDPSLIKNPKRLRWKSSKRCFEIFSLWRFWPIVGNRGTLLTKIFFIWKCSYEISYRFI